ncbi:siderophore ferric iron reductase [Pseudomonas sediminis]|uniref:Siderophore ferric iron reductase n=1 Tax=Pseudomonas sediminis TaxID=1691904 RepID=A0A2G5FFX1_9PSED|nr:siderophore ferric iron reductase [Pseudomonas sediminis]PIA66900.1 siderophore ferric iron reductase [Pseudomonas sediminis]
MHDLHHLLDVISRSLPGLQGRIGDAEADLLVCGSDGNAQRIATLYQHWRQAHPEAGPHYWTVRSWTYLVWQPIYLTLLGVHLAQRMPCLSTLGQDVQSGVVLGFCLPDHCPQRAAEDELINLAGSQLADLLRRQHVEFCQVQSIHGKLAQRLAADFVLAALLLVQRQLNLDNQQLRGLSARWLEALGLRGGSELLEVRLEDGRDCLTLERKACCQHFRRCDGELCSTCPKLRRDERLVRLREELAQAC